MRIAFDPAKDELNIAKHGISLARAADLQDLIVVEDERFAGERRYRLYGMIDDQPHCLAAVFRSGIVRAISLRRTHRKEFQRYVAP